MRPPTLTAGAAIAAVLVANNGLQTWKNQLKGTVEYELTRRLLRSTYKYRDAFSVVRNPTMWGGEYKDVPTDFEGNRELREHVGIAGAYERRWKHVIDARRELEAELLEAEVVWDSSARENFKPIFQLQGELFSLLHLYLVSRDPRRSEHDREIYANLLRKRRDALYESGMDEDTFGKDLNEYIKAIEEWLKPHLRK